MQIEVVAHADCRGTNDYNKDLSQRRANATLRYIQARITKPDRVKGKGLGESKPVNGCACEGSTASYCSESEHQKNRRSEFIVKK